MCLNYDNEHFARLCIVKPLCALYANMHYNSTEAYNMKVILLKKGTVRYLQSEFAIELDNNDMHMLLSWNE